MKAQIMTLLFLGLLFPVVGVSANTLNEVVKEARKQGQVLSAKTRHGMHEVRVVTPRGSVKTIRKPATQQNRSQQQPDSNFRQKSYQPQRPRQEPHRSDNRRDNQRTRQPEFRSFQRQSQSSRPSRSRQPSPQPRRQPVPSRSDDRNPD